MGVLGHYLPGCRVMVHFSLGTLEGDWIISSSQAFPASSSVVWRRLRSGHVPPLTRWGRGPNRLRIIGPALASGSTRGRRPRFGHIDRQSEEGCGRARASQPGRTTRPLWNCSARVFCSRHQNPPAAVCFLKVIGSEQVQAGHFEVGDTVWNQVFLPFLEHHFGEERKQGHLKT